MITFLQKYNAVTVETAEDEGKLSLDSCKTRLLKTIKENIENFQNNSWNRRNYMNKLIIDRDANSIFTIRLGGKKIAKYSLVKMDTVNKIAFLLDVYKSVQSNEFDDVLLDFLAKEVEEGKKRKKADAERRKQRLAEKKKAKEATTLDTAVASGSIPDELRDMIKNI